MAEAQTEKASAKGKAAAGKGRASTGPAQTASAADLAAPKDYTARLRKHYHEVVRPAMIEQFGYKNPFEVPTIEKIVLNMGVGDAVNDTKKVTTAAADLALIAGQRPVITRARKAISSFKVRENMPIGAKVTLRSTRMYEFLDRLVSVAIPRIRDFRGIPGKSFDGRGNFNFGIKEQIIFPEIEYDKIDALRGMNITITTTAKTDAEGRALLAAFKFPFRN